jgi:hypothetical protein
LFDERLCLKVIERNKGVFEKYFDGKVFKLVDTLLNDRNRWAHTSGIGMPKDQAYDILYRMACLIKEIDTNSENEILSIREEMFCASDKERPILANKENLINFLEANVWIPMWESKNITEEIRNKSEYTNKYMKEELRTASEVVGYFWSCINSHEGIIFCELLDEKKLPTFEKVRKKFMQLCYGK